MKHLKFTTACSLCFLAGVFVPLKSIHAQKDNPRETYYMISFMKTRAGQDALKMEQELWKPLQSDRVNRGDIDSWNVIQPVFSGPHPYDYMTVETASSMDKLTHPNYAPAVSKVWTNEKYNANLERTMNARDELGSELWIAVEGVSKTVK